MFYHRFYQKIRYLELQINLSISVTNLPLNSGWLNHIHPDGASTRITYGVFNLAHRKGSEMATPLSPGEVFDVEFSPDQIAYRVPAGHKSE